MNNFVARLIKKLDWRHTKCNTTDLLSHPLRVPGRLFTQKHSAPREQIETERASQQHIAGNQRRERSSQVSLKTCFHAVDQFGIRQNQNMFRRNGHQSYGSANGADIQEFFPVPTTTNLSNLFCSQKINSQV